MVREVEAEKKGMRIGKYDLRRMLGEGNFGKVKFSNNIVSDQDFAVKILDLRIDDQIKREIGTLKLLKHLNVVRLYDQHGTTLQAIVHHKASLGTINNAFPIIRRAKSSIEITA